MLPIQYVEWLEATLAALDAMDHADADRGVVLELFPREAGDDERRAA